MTRAMRWRFRAASQAFEKDRERTVERLKNGSLDILVATDVAARGLDVDRISHVIHYDIPYDTLVDLPRDMPEDVFQDLRKMRVRGQVFLPVSCAKRG